MKRYIKLMRSILSVRSSIRGDSEALPKGVQLRPGQMVAFLLPHSGGEATMVSGDGRGTKTGGSGQK